MFASYNYIHIIYLCCFPLMLISIYFLFRNKKLLTQNYFLLFCVLICAVFEFYDTFKYVPLLGWSSVFMNLPIFACDLNIFILGFIIIERIRNKEHPLLYKFILYFTTTGPLFSLLFPEIQNNTHLWYADEVIGSFIPHTLYVIVAILFLKFNNIKVTTKQPWKVGLLMQIMIFTVHCINLFLAFSEINIYSNYMFTISPPMAELYENLALTFGYNNKYIKSYLLIAFSYIIMTILFYVIHIICEKLVLKKVEMKSNIV